MKKKLLTTLFAILACISINAQSIIGTWEYVIPNDSDDPGFTGASLVYDITEGDVTCKFYINIEDDALGKVVICYSAPGAYLYRDNLLDINVITSKITVGIEQWDYSEDMIQLLRDNPGMEQTMRDAILDNLVNEDNSHLEWLGQNTWIVKSITAKALILVDEVGDSLTFNKITNKKK